MAKKIKDADDNYATKKEKVDRLKLNKLQLSMKTPGMATALKKSQKDMGKAKLPKVKAKKKALGLVR